MTKKIPNYKQIQNSIREQIFSGKLRPGDRVPSEKEIVEQFFVSQITAKQALNGLVDENLVVRYKGKGSFVANRSSHDLLNSINSNLKGVVGIIFPSICMPIESELFYLVQSLMHENGYQTLARVTDDNMDKEIEAIRMFRIFGVRGFIIFPAIDENYNEEILRLTLERYPLVMVDRYLPKITNSSVTSENVNAIANVVDYLMDSGYENILFILQRDTNSNTHERILGFEKAFTKRQLPIDKTNWLYVKPVNTKDYNATKSEIEEFYKAHSSATAIITIDSVLASLTYDVLNEMGLSIPQDIKLVSFDNPRLPFVPYIQQDVGKMAHRAVDILLSQMEGSYQIISEKIPTKFVTDVRYPLPYGV